jgi:molybdopterin/thiamine biosynthesis adenylyltransferase
MVTARDIPDPEHIFRRNQPAISRTEQDCLAESSVVICGCGGLGGSVIEQLARIGVGRLRMVDPDDFATSNLNRQAGALLDTLARNKASVMAGRVAAINLACRTEPVTGDIRDTNCLRDMNVAVDCLDNSPSRLELARQCARAGLPLVHGAVHGWYGQSGVLLPGDDRYEKIYGRQAKENGHVAVLAPAVFAIAAIQAALVIKLLLGRPCRLGAHWLHIDLLEDEFTCL